jgi:hypothetical protein
MNKIKHSASDMLKSLSKKEVSEYCICLAKLVIQVDEFKRKKDSKTGFFHSCNSDVHVCVNKLIPAISRCLYEILRTNDIRKIEKLVMEIHKILRFKTIELIAVLKHNNSDLIKIKEVILNGFN